MDTDDLEPNRSVLGEPKDLEVLSVTALEEYIVELEAEITRVRKAIAGKHSAKTAAESFFKS
ncbi:DUF1192 domain-containing protein [Aestuariispira ectoiniformans]|uniref:DUF1192 domain-containing protein n=1 Tax=Aestuariispira ectoiniformans TaxID=2775080 RepID=UPI00223ADCAD|nr:DUF1192 domain-containing protein [Aestuariispira ectoiniformans]